MHGATAPVEQREADAAERLDGEQLQVWSHRYRAARAAGIDDLNAALFAYSSADIGRLRELHRAGCRPDLIARILL